MGSTITEGRNEIEEGSLCYLLKEQTTTTTTATKCFESASSLSSWLHAPTTPKLYKVLNVDWTKNQVKVECIPLAVPVVVGATDAAE